jgi:asparaginyl-tRNA synthetase
MSNSKVYYICTTEGNDELGDGSTEKPLQSLFKAVCVAESTNTDLFLVSVSKDSKKEWEKPSKSAMKKAQGRYEENKKKKEKAALASTEAVEKSEKRLEEAKKIQISLDPNLPAPKTVKIRECKDFADKRVKVFAFVHRFRQQSF